MFLFRLLLPPLLSNVISQEWEKGRKWWSWWWWWWYLFMSLWDKETSQFKKQQRIWSLCCHHDPGCSFQGMFYGQSIQGHVMIIRHMNVWEVIHSLWGGKTHDLDWDKKRDLVERNGFKNGCKELVKYTRDYTPEYISSLQYMWKVQN